jgi:DNA (cytosine-5)-methyltransferase 1
MSAYYNEIDHAMCAWLSNLMDAGFITPGRIDDRSIYDVRPDDVMGYERVHFFAGIAGWDYALNLAGWQGPVWTGSCPCQPFSAAGKGLAQTDERHLWPVWFNLIKKCRPDIIFGEQVERAIKHNWLDDLQTDMETEGYATGSCVLPACGCGAPHIRARLWFVAERLGDTHSSGPQRRDCEELCEYPGECVTRKGGTPLRMENPESHGRGRGSDGSCAGESREIQTTGLCASGGMADTKTSERWRTSRKDDRRRGVEKTGRPSIVDRPAPTNGFWRDADWLYCRDGKWRAVKPESFPLAPRLPGRMVQLRGLGNAIVPQIAAEFIKAYMVVK